MGRGKGQKIPGLDRKPKREGGYSNYIGSKNAETRTNYIELTSIEMK